MLYNCSQSCSQILEVQFGNFRVQSAKIIRRGQRCRWLKEPASTNKVHSSLKNIFESISNVRSDLAPVFLRMEHKEVKSTACPQKQISD